MEINNIWEWGWINIFRKKIVLKIKIKCKFTSFLCTYFTYFTFPQETKSKICLDLLHWKKNRNFMIIYGFCF